jgi:hypothetical protein
MSATIEIGMLDPKANCTYPYPSRYGFFDLASPSFLYHWSLAVLQLCSNTDETHVPLVCCAVTKPKIRLLQALPFLFRHEEEHDQGGH